MTVLCQRLTFVRSNRPSPLLLSDKDGKLRAKIWDEIIVSLEKDVPEVMQLVHV